MPSQDEEDRRMHHAIAVHGLEARECEDGSCFLGKPCTCGGSGILFRMRSTEPCGPSCPLGNPQ